MEKYDGITRLYPTFKALQADHLESSSELISKRLIALIEYEKTWNYSLKVKEKIAFLKSVGPPYYSTDGTEEDHSLFFSRFAIDEELQGIFRYFLKL